MTLTDEPPVIDPAEFDRRINEATPDSEKVPCQECGEMYKQGPGLARHMAKAHPEIRMATQDAECPECGKWLTTGSMTRHRRRVHGIHKKRGPGRPPGSKNLLPSKRTPTVKASVDRNPNPLTADEIITAAAISLFPGGVPTRKLPILLRWHQSTQVFLREVNDE